MCLPRPLKLCPYSFMSFFSSTLFTSFPFAIISHPSLSLFLSILPFHYTDNTLALRYPLHLPSLSLSPFLTLPSTFFLWSLLTRKENRVIHWGGVCICHRCCDDRGCVGRSPCIILTPIRPTPSFLLLSLASLPFSVLFHSYFFLFFFSFRILSLFFRTL